jgi:hypothetical protein
MPTYTHITAPVNPAASARGGYKDILYFCPVADFASIAVPSGSGVGSSLTIGTAHTFTSTAGFFTYDSKQKVVTVKGATIGDPGARLIEWTFETIILGDGASTQEQLQALLNAKVIALVKDAKCTANEYVQFGDSCVQPEFSVEFDGKTTAEGLKEYKVTGKIVASKYFYTGAVTLSTAP